MIGEQVCWFQVHFNSPSDYGYTVFHGTCIEEHALKDGYICESNGSKKRRWVPKEYVRRDPRELKQAALERVEWLRENTNAALDSLKDEIEASSFFID